MLYVTTRSDQEKYTAHRAIHENRAPDGGFFVPFHDPVLSSDDLRALKELSVNGRIAQILNRIFQTRLTDWDIAFSIGRKPIKLISLRNRIAIGEFWHNPSWSYSKMESSLGTLICEDNSQLGDWTKIGIRIAVLSAVCMESDAAKTDVSVVGGDLLWMLSAWYAKKWGIPIGSIIVCCNENKNLWDLICHGQMRTDAVSILTELPEADIAVPTDLERLVFACGGREEVEVFLECCRQGRVYYPGEKMLSALRDGQFVSVVSSGRMYDAIPGVWKTHRYLLSPAVSLAYSGLLDYRAKKGVICPALVISENSPAADLKMISHIMGIPEEEIKRSL